MRNMRVNVYTDFWQPNLPKVPSRMSMMSRERRQFDLSRQCPRRGLCHSGVVDRLQVAAGVQQAATAASTTPNCT